METLNSQRRRRSIGLSKALALAISAVFWIVFLLAPSASAVPLSRSIKATRAIPDLSAQTGSWGSSEYKVEGRKLFDQTNDYGDTGANDKHDPPPR